jgi:antimicrobial peptide system SdpA family protein
MNDESLTPPAAVLRKTAALSIVLTLIWGTIFAYALHAALPPTALKLPFEEKLNIRYFTPEGWAFFTRNAREDRYYLYRLNAEGRWESALMAPHHRPSNIFGLDRKSRAQGVEMGMLSVQVDAKEWKECRSTHAECLASAPILRTVTNKSPRPTLCGEIGLVTQPPVPWAWASTLERPVTMPLKAARLTVNCQ